MSRSYRKTPIIGNTVSDSDKPFKKTEHRRARRSEALELQKVLLDPYYEPEMSDKEYGNPWASPKDGKRYQPALEEKDMRK